MKGVDSEKFDCCTVPYKCAGGVNTNRIILKPTLMT